MLVVLLGRDSRNPFDWERCDNGQLHGFVVFVYSHTCLETRSRFMDFVCGLGGPFILSPSVSKNQKKVFTCLGLVFL